MAKNRSKDINPIGIFAAFEASIKSMPGKWKASVIPTVKKATIKLIKVLIPTMINIIPINFAITFKKNMIIEQIESKKVFQESAKASRFDTK